MDFGEHEEGIGELGLIVRVGQAWGYVIVLMVPMIC